MAGSVIGALRVNLGLDSGTFIRDIDAASKKTTAATASMSSAFKSLAVSLAGAFGVAELTRAVDTYSQMTSQLRLVTDSAANLAEVEKQLFAVSQANRVGLESTVGLYARIARATEAMGVSQAQVLQVTDTINKALVISGTSAQEASGALMQLGQAFASGALRGDELNSILEGMPRVAQAIAEGMGVTVGQLRKLGEEGKLTSQEVFNALMKMSGDIQSEFAKMPPTVGQSLTVLQNAFLRFIGQLDQVTGASQAVAQAFITISQSLPAVASVVGGLTAAFAAHRVALLAVALATSNFGKAVAFNASVVMATSRSIGVMQGAQVALAGATSIATGAFRSLTAVMIANPFGAIAVGVGVLTTAFMGLANAQAQARAETDNLIRSLDAAIKARGADVALKRAEADVERGRAQARLTQLEAQLGRQKGVGGGFAAQALGQEITDLRWKVIELEGTVRLADRTLADMNKTAGQVAVPVARAAGAVTNLGTSASGAGGGLRQMGNDASAAAGQVQSLMDRLFPAAAKARKLREELALLDKSNLSDAQKDEARFRLGTEGLGKATVSKSLLNTDPIIDASEELRRSQEELARDSEVQTVRIAQSFAEMSQRVVGSLQGLTNSIRSGDFLGILGGVLDIFSQLGSAGLFGKGLQSKLNAPTFGGARAMGGPVSAGKQYLVGENGPELFAPGRSGRIVPNHSMGASQVQIVPSPYFNVVVDGRIATNAPAVANLGAMQAQGMAARSARRRVR
jgi:tape measure domain-containing protein